MKNNIFNIVYTHNTTEAFTLLNFLNFISITHIGRGMKLNDSTFLSPLQLAADMSMIGWPGVGMAGVSSPGVSVTGPDDPEDRGSDQEPDSEAVSRYLQGRGKRHTVAMTCPVQEISEELQRKLACQSPIPCRSRRGSSKSILRVNLQFNVLIFLLSPATWEL